MRMRPCSSHPTWRCGAPGSQTWPRCSPGWRGLRASPPMGRIAGQDHLAMHPAVQHRQGGGLAMMNGRHVQAGCEHCATRSICVLAPLDAERLRSVQASVRQRSFGKGETLTRAGERVVDLYVLKVGTVIGSRSGLDGVDRPLGIWGRGTVFGLCGFLGRAAELSTMTITPDRVCTVPVQQVAAEAADQPAVNEYLGTLMAGGYDSMAAWSHAMRVTGVVKQLPTSCCCSRELRAARWWSCRGRTRWPLCWAPPGRRSRAPWQPSNAWAR